MKKRTKKLSAIHDLSLAKENISESKNIINGILTLEKEHINLDKEVILNSLLSIKKHLDIAHRLMLDNKRGLCNFI